MASAMQKVLAKMADEFHRLDDFLNKSEERSEVDDPAVLETEKVVILTRNHGHFVLDRQDIFGILEKRRDDYKKDLKDYTFLGENIKGLRPGPPKATE
jgi:hypothetical protein